VSCAAYFDAEQLDKSGCSNVSDNIKSSIDNMKKNLNVYLMKRNEKANIASKKCQVDITLVSCT
jgi:hypothetical protein